MKIKQRLVLLFPVVLLAVLAAPISASANHSWGGFHWARTANPFTLSLGDNVSSGWDSYLSGASTDWSVSTILDTRIVNGTVSDVSKCAPTSGRVEICNAAYGTNGWLGVATIWLSGRHITQATARVNDTYFSAAPYNTPAWQRMVMCQEIGHTLGLDHQDEKSGNANLGTCMDYTNDPDGPPSNEHPNQHDYDQLEKIYRHLDRITTVSALPGRGNGNGANGDYNAPEQWGQVVRTAGDGRSVLYHRDLGNGVEMFTFVIWAR